MEEEKRLSLQQLVGEVRKELFSTDFYSLFPFDKEFIELCLIDHLESLGCSQQHFAAEIDHIMGRAYQNWVMNEQQGHGRWCDAAMQIYQDSLAFRLLRMHGYHVTSCRFCWFVHDKEMLVHMQENHADYFGAMYSIYKASHLLFNEEDDLEKARKISRELLQRGLSCKKSGDHRAGLTDLKIEEIDRELRVPYLARMDHLEHRKYIEECNGYYDIWFGKAPACRLLFPQVVQQLAVKNFMMRQSIYRDEAMQLIKWSKDMCLSNIGFGRDKAVYCYFAIASTMTNLPRTSELRKLIAQCATIITVADDFFDEKGSMDELCLLTKAVQRWSGEGLSGEAKIIFDALVNLVNDNTLKAIHRHSYNVEKNLQGIWQEAFGSWLKESLWSKNGDTPSTKEYLEVAKISVGVKLIVLPSYLIMSKKLPYNMNSADNTMTDLLMVLCRLLNDTESYQKEVKDGKQNMVLLYMKENKMATIEQSIADIRSFVERMQKEFLALALSIDNNTDVPKEWRALHLACLKMFLMFYNSGNAFDSNTALLEDISKAIYDPLEFQNSMQPKQQTYPSNKENTSFFNAHTSNNILLTKYASQFGGNYNFAEDHRRVSSKTKNNMKTKFRTLFQNLANPSTHMFNTMSVINQSRRPISWTKFPLLI